MSNLPTERLMKFSRDVQASKKAPKAVRCGDLLCDGAEAECPACDGDGFGRNKKHSDWPDRRTKCQTCHGTRRVRIMPARSHSNSDH